MGLRKPSYTQTNRESAPRAYRLLATIGRFLVPLVARRRWLGEEHIPATGPAIVVANHISNIDPILIGEFLIWNGRWPRFLGKASLWKVPVLGWMLAKADQIPVYRDSERAAESLVHAKEALEAGKLVTIYPEGTITGDPDGWPMTGRRGAAHLALVTGAPLIPWRRLEPTSSWVGSTSTSGACSADARTSPSWQVPRSTLVPTVARRQPPRWSTR